MKKLAIGLLVMLGSMHAMAEDGQKSTRPLLNEKVKAAFEECKVQGRPSSEAFESCMQSKGFKRPERRQDGEHGHKRPEGLRNALEACKVAGKPREPAFESCMLEKGFKKPAGMKEHQGKQ